MTLVHNLSLDLDRIKDLQEEEQKAKEEEDTQQEGSNRLDISEVRSNHLVVYGKYFVVI